MLVRNVCVCVPKLMAELHVMLLLMMHKKARANAADHSETHT